jgi:hypothetical protein
MWSPNEKLSRSESRVVISAFSAGRNSSGLLQERPEFGTLLDGVMRNEPRQPSRVVGRREGKIWQSHLVSSFRAGQPAGTKGKPEVEESSDEKRSIATLSSRVAVLHG